MTCERITPPHDKGCNRGAPFTGQLDAQNQCTACWLWANDPERCKRIWMPRKPSTIAQRAVQFLQAIQNEIHWRLSGGNPPSDKERSNRRLICNTCEHRNTEEDGCNICGCYLEPKFMHIPPIPYGKLDCSTQTCPINKWSYAGGYVGPKNCPNCSKPCTGCGQKQS